jgi:hypothetical protein
MNNTTLQKAVEYFDKAGTLSCSNGEAVKYRYGKEGVPAGGSEGIDQSLITGRPVLGILHGCRLERRNKVPPVSLLSPDWQRQEVQEMLPASAPRVKRLARLCRVFHIFRIPRMNRNKNNHKEDKSAT